jgi:hypothetical protein
MGEKGEELIYVRQKFSRISEAKVKEDIFVGLEVKQPFQGLVFRNQLNSGERAF